MYFSPVFVVFAHKCTLSSSRSSFRLPCSIWTILAPQKMIKLASEIAQKAVPNLDPFWVPIWFHFGFILVPFGAPQIRPKVAHWALKAHLGALKFSLGAPSDIFDLY